MDKGIGQYDTEYGQCKCFWGSEPGKYVKLIPNFIETGNVLDLGAGEGKNSIFLAQLGFKVKAIEISEYAIENFQNEVSKLDAIIAARIQIIQGNVLDYKLEEKFNVVVAYGLLHCCRSLDEVDTLIAKIKKWTNENGIVVIVCFNNILSIPTVQNYLEPTLIPIGYLKREFEGWEILLEEDGIITETHPTSDIEHQHSVSRIILQRTNGK